MRSVGPAWSRHRCSDYELSKRVFSMKDGRMLSRIPKLGMLLPVWDSQPTS